MYRYSLKNKFLFLLIAGILLTFSSCKSQKETEGPEDNIYIVADTSTYNKLKDALESSFEKIILTPQVEKSFKLSRKDFKDIEEVKKHKNIIIIAQFNSNTEEFKLISKILDNKQKQEITKENKFVFIKNDLWKKNQMVMVLSLPEIEVLRQHILRHSDNLIRYFNKAEGKRMFEALAYSDFERKEIEDKLYKDYGWKIFVPDNFDLALNIPIDKFVWLRNNVGNDFAKWIFIHWIDNASPELITSDSILFLRNKLTEKYFRSDDKKSFVKINPKYIKTNEVNFIGHYALASQGLWEMNDKSKGGPFINYSFYDEKTKRVYMLDGSIYAPKYYKKDLIQQLDIILQSFISK